MGNALKKEPNTDAIQLDVRDAFSAALKRAQEVPMGATILDMISSDEWKKMDERNENILVQDPE